MAPSFLYRFVPDDPTPCPGALQKGGRLEAAGVEEVGRDADRYETGRTVKVLWRRVEPENAPADALANGCVRFSRLEGAAFSGGALWFSDTTGGTSGLGQVFRYLPATATLELFLDSDAPDTLKNPDNATVTPWSDLWLAEDGPDETA